MANRRIGLPVHTIHTIGRLDMLCYPYNQNTQFKRKLPVITAKCNKHSKYCVCVSVGCSIYHNQP